LAFENVHHFLDSCIDDIQSEGIVTFSLFFLKRSEFIPRGVGYIAFMSRLRELFTHVLEHYMAKTFADLTKAIADNTTATNAAVAAFNSASSQDFSAPVAAIAANTAALNALVPSGPGTSPLSASPASVTLSASAPSQVVALTGAVGNVTAASNDLTVATVSATAPWTINRVAAGNTTVKFSDSAVPPNIVSITVSAV
jgi:hypothetical protein